jgi:hypothetical protein
MQIINSKCQLTINLFHGTSTLFLDSIIQNGLGGLNPVVEWRLLELCKEVYQLSEQHLKETLLFQRSSYSFKKMAEQSNSGSFNFQHGNTYLSPSKQTASRYAINKRYGSELLTYTIDFLNELLKLEIQYVKSDLFRKYPKIFGLIEANPSPLLIQVKNVIVSSLVSEHGQDPTKNLERVDELINESSDFFDVALQQTNFRLIAPVTSDKLRFWLINVQKWNSLTPQYNLYELRPENTY